MLGFIERVEDADKGGLAFDGAEELDLVSTHPYPLCSTWGRCSPR